MLHHVFCRGSDYGGLASSSAHHTSSRGGYYNPQAYRRYCYRPGRRLRRDLTHCDHFIYTLRLT